MPQCAGIKRDGGRCMAIINGSQQYCFQHDPARAEDRRRAASKAGKSRPSRELQAIKTRLSELAEGVLEGEIDRADAAVAGQLLNYVIRAVGMELKVKESEELERRVEQLETLLEQRSGHRNRGQAW